jgi:hypothetical protein
MRIFCSPYKDKRLVHFTADVESHLALKLNIVGKHLLPSILAMTSWQNLYHMATSFCFPKLQPMKGSTVSYINTSAQFWRWLIVAARTYNSN